MWTVYKLLVRVVSESETTEDGETENSSNSNSAATSSDLNSEDELELPQNLEDAQQYRVVRIILTPFPK